MKQTDENGKPITYWGGLKEDKQKTNKIMKQTAVQWLVEELNNIKVWTKNDIILQKADILIEQAKEMEKQQQGYTKEKVLEIERYRAIDFVKWFSDFNGLTWEEKRVTKERLDTLYEKYLGTLGGGI